MTADAPSPSTKPSTHAAIAREWLGSLATMPGAPEWDGWENCVDNLAAKFEEIERAATERERERAAKLVLCARAVPEIANNWWFGERAKLAAAIRREP